MPLPDGLGGPGPLADPGACSAPPARRPFGRGPAVSLFSLGTMRALESADQLGAVLAAALAADINHIETFVPTAGEAAGPPIESHATFVPAAGEAAGPPIVSVMIIRFDRTRDDRGGPTTLSYVVDELNLGLYLGVKRLMHWA